MIKIAVEILPFHMHYIWKSLLPEMQKLLQERLIIKKTDIYEGQVMITRDKIFSIEKFEVEGRTLRQTIIERWKLIFCKNQFIGLFEKWAAALQESSKVENSCGFGQRIGAPPEAFGFAEWSAPTRKCGKPGFLWSRGGTKNGPTINF